MPSFKPLLLLIICILSKTILTAQYSAQLPVKERYMRIMFYNVENLFDTKDDSLTNDNEFLPSDAKYWTSKRYKEKLHHIASVIVAIGGWNPPEIIGLCEIENQKILEDLCKGPELNRINYSIIHKESKDSRGIDVAMLYRKKYFKPLNYNAIQVFFPFSPGQYTRDILYVCGLTKNNDTLHVFINHWPSRFGGQVDSERNRIEAAKTLRYHVDSLFSINQNAKILIMGDFNDYPENISLTESLKARNNFDTIYNNQIYNLSAFIAQNKKIGSHKYQGEWGILDQTIVSGAMLNSPKGLITKKENAFIFNADFLLVDDENYTGKTNFRTYNGYKYIGGYSDHLPVFIDLENKQ